MCTIPLFTVSNILGYGYTVIYSTRCIRLEWTNSLAYFDKGKKVLASVFINYNQSGKKYFFFEKMKKKLIVTSVLAINII